MTQQNRAKLVRMLNEGRITMNQYEEFVANLPEEDAHSYRPEPTSDSPGLDSDSKAPWYIATCAILLFTVAILSLLVPLSGLAGFSGVMGVIGVLIVVLLDTALGIGLLMRSRIAYVLGCVAVVAAVIVPVIRGNLPAFIINSVFAALLLPGYSWFFPDERTGTGSLRE